MVCKVVSIEDEPEIAELLRIVLASPQIEIYSCDNGPDGVQLVRACKPDLVILDIMLPGMNGWAVYDTIRADDELKMTPIVMLSVLREQPARRQAFVGSPVDLYVTKPFDTLRLREGIERMLGRKGLWSTTKPLIRGTGELKPVEVTPEEPAPSGNGSLEGKPAAEQPESPPAPPVIVPPLTPQEQPAAIETSEKQPVAETSDKPIPQVVAVETGVKPPVVAAEIDDKPIPQVAAAENGVKPPETIPPAQPGEPVSAAEKPGPDSKTPTP